VTGITPEQVQAQWDECGRKNRYTKKRAFQVARKMRAEQPNEEPQVRPYRCPWGWNHWHVGHQSRKYRKDIE
jgi:hypothetical protein